MADEAALKAREALAQLAEKREARTPGTIWSRRDFFSLAGWAGILGTLAVAALAFLRYMFPRVLFEPSPVFNAGDPAGYNTGAVDERWKQGQRVWVVRKDDGSFYALLAICTHLGCTPNWLNAENKFKCPCHGSGFRRDGTNFEGPAPRPLDRVRIVLSPDGTLVVDKSQLFSMKPGKAPDAQSPQSILKV